MSIKNTTTNRDLIKSLERENKNLKQAIEELSILNEISVSASKIIDENNIIDLIIEQSVKAVTAEEGAILLVPPSKQDELKTYVRREATNRYDSFNSITKDIAGWVLKYKKALIIDDLLNDDRFNSYTTKPQKVRTVICVPILVHSVILGVLLMLNKKKSEKFNKNDLRFLSIIAGQAGRIIRYISLRKEAEEKKNMLRLKELEAEKLEELNKLKSKFFENIAHEFKTPLSLILGPANQMLKMKSNEKVDLYCKLIKGNAEKLLYRVNQILELSKLYSPELKLKLQPIDLTKFISDIVNSFHPWAERKKIILIKNINQKLSTGYLDLDKTEKIISNILSNSLKFTKQNGQIKVTASLDSQDQKMLYLKISDTGIGIPANQIEKVFNRFYQIENNQAVTEEGTGLGLALVKELVNIHKGNIKLTSTVNKGTTIKLHLPISLESYPDEEIISDNVKVNNEVKINPAKDEVDNNLNDKEERISILVIEDNIDVSRYLLSSLKSKYKVMNSLNGADGLGIALEEVPDLIITDIMMPEMDGMELCKKIKTDERISHIPVIMLTARATSENKIEGLETGADDYITKPFDVEELIARIDNLILQRKELSKRFSRRITLDAREISITSVDERFIQNLMSVINQKISDPELTVQYLSEKLGFSRVQLFRKIKALTNKSVSEFIRSVRLKRALVLLTKKSGNISEIAYDVGFNNPAYFSQCFKKEFGKLPSEF